MLKSHGTATMPLHRHGANMSFGALIKTILVYAEPLSLPF